MKIRNNLKVAFFLFVTSFFIINIFFLGIWYKYYIVPSLNEQYETLQREVSVEIQNIQKHINSNSTSDVNSMFSYIVEKYDVTLILQDIAGNIIFDNTKGVDTREFLTPFLININNKVYLLSIGKSDSLSYSSVVRSFMACELLIIGILILIGIAFASKGILNPVADTLADIKNYRFGKKPQKRKISGQIDYIQNAFVDLTLDLEKEKEEQNRIISSISHDIKTPLTSIMGYTELLKKKKLTKEEKEYLDKIYTKAVNIKDIVNDFDDYLLSNKTRTYSFKEIVLKDLLNNLKFEYEKDLKDKNIEFKIINKCKTKVIKLDVTKIQRVFSNIITNSIRYLDDKGLIKIEVSENEKDFIFKISDNGKGVDDDKLEKIFDPLYTTDKSRKISGLGLSICREIVTMHGGFIKAYNSKDKGLIIEFSINKDLNNS